MQANAATLHVCSAALPATGAHDTIISRPGAAAQRVFVSDTARIEGCRSTPLPVALDRIAGLKPVASAAALGAGVFLHGVEKEGGFSIDSVSGIGEPAPAGPRPMPWRENLLPQMQARVFGVEERVQARIADGRLTLQCAAGSRPAGVILSGPWIMSRARSELDLSGLRGDAGFGLHVIDAAAAATESALELGSLDARMQDGLQMALPGAAFDPAAWRGFAIACPREQASLQLDALSLRPRSATAAGGRSAWVWQPAAWSERADEVFAHARRHAIRTLFISVPVRDGAVADAPGLAAFVRAASRSGIAVWSVDGDARMVLPEEHAPSAARVRAYVAYNAGVETEARLRGMQFDVEHYLLPGYELAVDEMDRHYIGLAGVLHRAAAGLPLEFVAPFWWADKRELLRQLTPFTAGLSIMDYRTDPGEILRFAQPFLDWGVANGRQVRIALEAGPVAAEQQRRFAPAASGELWLLTPAQTPLLLLLKEPRQNPHGPAFRQVSSRILDGSATSFHADPARLLRLLPQLEQDFSAWASFGGIALHELR